MDGCLCQSDIRESARERSKTASATERNPDQEPENHKQPQPQADEQENIQMEGVESNGWKWNQPIDENLLSLVSILL